MTTYEYLSLFVEIEWQKRVVFLRIFLLILPLFFHPFFALKIDFLICSKKTPFFLCKK